MCRVPILKVRSGHHHAPSRHRRLPAGRSFRLCAALLARAHGQSPASAAIVSYLGRSEEFAEATAAWSAAYADVAEADFELLRQAVASGRLPAETGV